MTGFVVVALSDDPHYVSEVTGGFKTRDQATTWGKKKYDSDEENEKDVFLIEGEPSFKVMPLNRR